MPSPKIKRPAKKHLAESSLRILPGTARDVPAILKLIRGLAQYERLAHALRPSAKRLRSHGFGRRPYFGSLICTRAGRTVGYAIYFFAYSTFRCSPVLFVEDVFVLHEERGRGAGKALMVALAQIAVKKGCHQMEWIVLDWNKPSIDFYHRLGARIDKTWLLTRITDQRLRRLAQGRGT